MNNSQNENKPGTDYGHWCQILYIEFMCHFNVLVSTVRFAYRSIVSSFLAYIAFHSLKCVNLSFCSSVVIDFTWSRLFSFYGSDHKLILLCEFSRPPKCLPLPRPLHP